VAKGPRDQRDPFETFRLYAWLLSYSELPP